MCSSNTHSAFLDDKMNVCETNKKEAKSLRSSLDKMNVSEANMEKEEEITSIHSKRQMCLKRAERRQNKSANSFSICHNNPLTGCHDVKRLRHWNCRCCVYHMTTLGDTSLAFVCLCVCVAGGGGGRGGAGGAWGLLHLCLSRNIPPFPIPPQSHSVITLILFCLPIHSVWVMLHHFITRLL